MTINVLDRAFGSLGQRPAPVQWVILLALSAVFVLLLELGGLPAALLLGPMAAAIMVSAAEGSVRVPRRPFFVAQGVIGCLIASTFTPALIGMMGHHWPLFLGSIMAVIIASSTLGWLLARWGVLPGSTTVWGSSPGAATAMTLMAEAYGADVRLVAFMQYLRVVLVAVVASVVSRIWAPPGGSGDPLGFDVWFPSVAWGPFAATLALAGIGAFVARRLRLPAGPLLLPLAVGTVLHVTGVMPIELPPWLLAVSYALVGWSIGLRFTRPILVHAARALPRLAASTLALIVLCGGLAFILTRFAGIDPLTAYLATSPGGADSVAIIASSAKVDLPFVMALQTARFLMVLMVGPSIARFIARRVP